MVSKSAAPRILTGILSLGLMGLASCSADGTGLAPHEDTGADLAEAKVACPITANACTTVSRIYRRCVTRNVADGTACSGGSCWSGQCVPAPPPVDAGTVADSGTGASDAGSGLIDGGAADSGAAGADSSADGGSLLPFRTVPFTSNDVIFSNPERGFYHSVDLLAESNISWATSDGTRLLYTYIHLDPYRTSAIPASLLTQAQTAFDMARAAGVKLVLRFAYNNGMDADAPLSSIQSHLHTLGPFIRSNSDVIAVLQAGFIGAWGEWHSSTNGLTSTANEHAVLDALLAELPTDRATQIRTPMAKADIYGTAPLNSATAFTGTAASRIGHHNDCFLASDTDWGTYPSNAVEQWKTYLASDTLYVPMGGETCAVYPAHTDCAPAVAEMERLHFSFVNDDYNQDVIAGWTAGGCRDTIDRRLGYRLSLVDADLPTQLIPGRSFHARIRLHNSGFAAPMNPRPVVLELVSGSVRIPFTFPGVDPRRWLPGQDVTLEQTFVLPSQLPAGPVSVVLALRDASSRLASDARFSIRLANNSTWDAASGTNVLGVVQ